MHKLTFGAVLAVLTITTVASADEWSKTYDLTGKPDLRVQAGDGHVRMETWDQNKIEARVTTSGWKIGTSELEVVEHQQGNAVTIELRQHRAVHFSFGIDARRVEIAIRMPRSAKVNIRTDDGSILARGIAGELEFASGDGRLDLEDMDGNLRAHTDDGSVRASGRFDEVELRTSDGRVELEARPGSQVRRTWEVRTSDGSVTLRVPGDLAADVELHTGDGHITTNIPIMAEGSFSGHDVRGKMNGGGNRLVVHTGDGSVTLDKL